MAVAMMTRKDFLKKGCILCAGAGLASVGVDWLLKTGAFGVKTGVVPPREASFYKKIDEATVQCQLCPRGCTLSNGQRGFCRAREPINGKLHTFVYGAACAVHIDPMEKKPLFHFLPGTSIFSIATAGCNFRCKYCQNWQISQSPPEETFNEILYPKDVVNRAIAAGCPSIAYTYSEPSIFYEYMIDAARLAKASGIRNMYHSNGSLNQAPVEELSLHLDAADIDLKGFTQDFYTEVCAGYLDTVLNTLKTLKKNKVWLEITTLVVPTMNDDMAKIKEMCVWIKESLGPDVPVHFSRFWPQYKLVNLYPTPVETLEKAREAAMACGLNYVYLGNVPGHPAESTYCPKCKAAVIRRKGYTILDNNLKDGNCASCGREIAGVWS